MIDFVKKTLNRIKKTFKAETENSELINMREISHDDVNRFLQTGENTFFRREIIFGEEELVKIQLEQSLAIIRTYQINKSILTFSSAPSIESYNLLCSAYIWDIITYISACKNLKESSISYLESDICLLYIMILTYLPQYLKDIEPYVIKGLEYIFHKRTNNIREDKGNYGKNSIFPLALFLCENYNRPQCVKDILSKFCLPLTESYAYVLENICTKDNTVLTKCIDYLSKYHVENSKTTDITLPFHKEQWIYFPIEIISLLKFRNHCNLNNEFTILNSLISEFRPYISGSLEMEDSVLILFHRLVSSDQHG